MARKKAGNGYREYKLTRLMDGQFELTVRGIHQGEMFQEQLPKFGRADLQLVFAAVRSRDVEKRGVHDPDLDK